MGADAKRAQSHETATGLGGVLRIRAFAVLYAAETQSAIGDQLARVALSVLVFQRTGSAAATAATYAATYLPAILGGVVLAGLGDRLPRRVVMVGCDALRAALFALMAVPSLPMWAVVALLVAAVFLGPAFSAAEVSYLAAALDPDAFRAGNGLRMISNQGSQVLGFAVGGVVVAAVGAHSALLIDAATYALSAALIGALVRRTVPRPARQPEAAGVGDELRSGFAGLWRDRQVRWLLVLSALAGLFVVPEGLAVPFAAHVGASTVQAGLLLAAIPLGGALGAVVLVQFVRPAARQRAAAVMAVACGLPLVLSGVVARWPVAAVCWLLSGAFAAYQVEIMSTLVRRIPDEVRARSVGVASSVLLGAQGAGLVAFGGVAYLLSPAWAIGIAGAAGSVAALAVVAGALRGAERPAARHRAAVAAGAAVLEARGAGMSRSVALDRKGRA